MKTQDHKPIPDTYRKGGFAYTLLKREGDVALYAQHRIDGPGAGKLYGWEICIIRRHEGYSIGGRQTEPAEYLPGSGEWGKYGWTIGTQQGFEAVEAKFREVIESVNADSWVDTQSKEALSA